MQCQSVHHRLACLVHADKLDRHDLQQAGEQGDGELVAKAMLLDERVTVTSAMAPVAAEIIAGRPPAMAVTTAMQNEA